MCDPNTVAKLTLGAQASGAALDAAGTYANARNTRATAEANASIADQQAADALRRGKLSEYNLMLKTRQLKGTQRAAFAHGNLALDTGSPLDVLTSTDVMGAADVETNRQNTLNEADGFRMRAANYRAAASAANPFLATTSSLLTGASKVADKWTKFKESGVL